MRADGRQADQLRPVEFITDYTRYAEGSVLIAMGETRVLCNVTISEGVPRWMMQQGKPGGWITAEYSMLPRATQQRTNRETNGLGGRTQEIRRLIGRSLRTAVDLEKLGPRNIVLDCDVLQADGGTRTASITGGYVALALALGKLIQAGTLPPETLRGPVAAISVGVVQNTPLLDLCYSEDSTAEVDSNVVMNAEGRLIEVQGTAEGPPFARSTFNTMLDLAEKGIRELLQIQTQVLKNSQS